MKNLVSFYLKRRFLSRFALVLGVVIFVMCAVMAHADRIISRKAEVSVYLDPSCAEIKEQLKNRSSMYKDSIKGLTDCCVLSYEEGWVLSCCKEITDEVIKQVENDIRAVESDIYLRKADIVEKEFIERYRKSFTVRTENSRKTDISTVIVSVIFYLILTYSNLIANEIIYEKATHMLDMIMCAVGARVHFFSKILTAYLSLLIQGSWILRCRIFWLIIRFSEDHFRGLLEFSRDYVDLEGINMNTSSFVLMIVLIVTGLLFIQIIMRTVTCMFRDSEEAATFQNTYYIVLVVLYYLSVIKGSPIDTNTAVSGVLSYVPIASMVFMPIRVVSGKANETDIIIATVITIGVIATAVELLLPQYKKLLLRK